MVVIVAPFINVVVVFFSVYHTTQSKESTDEEEIYTIPEEPYAIPEELYTIPDETYAIPEELYTIPETTSCLLKRTSKLEPDGKSGFTVVASTPAESLPKEKNTFGLKPDEVPEDLHVSFVGKRIKQSKWYIWILSTSYGINNWRFAAKGKFNFKISTNRD